MFIKYLLKLANKQHFSVVHTQMCGMASVQLRDQSCSSTCNSSQQTAIEW